MFETGVSVAAQFTESLAAPIVRRFMYLYNYKRNLRNLEKEVSKLKDAKDKVCHLVEAAERNMEEIRRNVRQWLYHVESIILEAEYLIEKTTDYKCFNLIKRYKYSKKALRKVHVVAELLEGKKVFDDRVSYSIIPRDTSLRDCEVVESSRDYEVFESSGDYEVFESRRSIFKDILNALYDAQVNAIGVYGKGGIGKTTLVKEAARQVKEENLFDTVIFLEATETPNTKMIQEEIASNLGLKFDDKQTESEKIKKLYARLKYGKRVLIILDNIWTNNLEKIGIPYNLEGCKLLLTTRDRTLLDGMCSKSFLIDVLEEEEAWRLFRKMAGHIVNQLSRLAKDVCKECRGLPIVIATLARALRDKKQHFEWADALRKLRMPSPTMFKGVLDEYSKIALSYNYLKGEEHKKIFLLCSIMEHDAFILDLLKYVVGLNVLERVNLTIEEERNMLATILFELKDSCLLLDGSTCERFSMHEVVRSIAIRIAFSDQHIFIERNDFDKEWESKDDLKKCTMISVGSKIISDHYAEGLNCPELEFFYMVKNDSSFKFSEKFFRRLAKLKVLSLTFMPLLSLPSSVRHPISLQTLCLDYSAIEYVAIIGELKNLKILSLRSCYNVKQLPQEIGQLTQLRLLDLSDCQQLEFISPNVILSLFQLEELYMCGCFGLWKVERSNVILEELRHLSHLNILEIDINNDKILPKGFFSRKLERYNISIGDGSSDFGGRYILGDGSSKFGSSSISGAPQMLIESFDFNKHVALRTIKLKLKSPIRSEELQGMKNVEFLCLDKLQGVKNLLPELDEDGFLQLKHLYVHNNPNLLCLVDSTKDVTVFPLLESLIFFNLTNLVTIHKGQPSRSCFWNLKFMEVQSCDKLRNFFSFSTAKILPQLQTLRAEDCKKLSEIFAIAGEDKDNVNEGTDKVELSQLRSLSLKYVPRLAKFYSEVKTVSTSQTKEDELDTIIPFFDQKLVLPNLEVLDLHGMESEFIWHDHIPTSMNFSYRCLTRLTVWGCKKLKYIFPASMIPSFKRLQHIEICFCKNLKEIVAAGEEASPTFVFPLVTFLELKRLPRLVTFYPGRHTSEWPKLKKLEVSDCNEVKIFVSEYLSSLISEPAALFLPEKINHRLEEMTLSCKDNTIPPGILRRWIYLKKLKLHKSYLKSCEEVVKDSRITHLELENFYYLKYFWNQGYERLLIYLEVLKLRWCDKLIHVVPSFAFLVNLTDLTVEFCNGILINLIAPLAANSLVQLRKLEISDCKKMIEIVANDGQRVKHEIVFPKLKSLLLLGLKRLTCFCSSNDSFKFPCLDKLVVSGCCKMKTFCEGELSTPMLQEVNDCLSDEGYWMGDLNTTIQQLQKKNKGNSDSKAFILTGKDIMEMSQSQPEFHERKAIEIVMDRVSYDIPIRILETVNDLEKLELKASSYQELFSKEKEDMGARIMTKLKILKVLHCHDLFTLVSSSGSFENLLTLKVRNCNGLRSLVTSSTVKSLVQLQQMTIQQCEMLIVVVGNEGDEGKDEIVFGKLRRLSLDCLKSFTSFCCASYTFNFPSLDELIVDDCSEMRTFSGGALSTPSLQMISYFGKPETYDCGLNEAIQQLHEERFNNEWMI